MKQIAGSLLATAALLTSIGAAHSQVAAPAPLRPDQVAFRSLYKELVETNTSLSVGSCTLAAARMQAHLAAAGFPASDLHPFADPAHPKEGGLVAICLEPTPARNPFCCSPI